MFNPKNSSENSSGMGGKPPPPPPHVGTSSRIMSDDMLSRAAIAARSMRRRSRSSDDQNEGLGDKAVRFDEIPKISSPKKSSPKFLPKTSPIKRSTSTSTDLLAGIDRGIGTGLGGITGFDRGIFSTSDNTRGILKTSDRSKSQVESFNEEVDKIVSKHMSKSSSLSETGNLRNLDGKYEIVNKTSQTETKKSNEVDGIKQKVDKTNIYENMKKFFLITVFIFAVISISAFGLSIYYLIYKDHISNVIKNKLTDENREIFERRLSNILILASLVVVTVIFFMFVPMFITLYKFKEVKTINVETVVVKYFINYFHIFSILICFGVSSIFFENFIAVMSKFLS